MILKNRINFNLNYETSDQHSPESAFSMDLMGKKANRRCISLKIKFIQLMKEKSDESILRDGDYSQAKSKHVL